MPMNPTINTVRLRRPYLLFLGEETNPLKAKTAIGLLDWARDSCIGQMRAPGGTVDLGLPNMDPAAAREAGAGSFLIGVTPVGGVSFLAGWVLMLIGAIRLKRKGVVHE